MITSRIILMKNITILKNKIMRQLLLYINENLNSIKLITGWILIILIWLAFLISVIVFWSI